MKHKLFAFICLLLAVLTFLCACKTTKNPEEISHSTSEGSGEPSVPGYETDANGYVKDSIPSGLNFNNDEFTIVGWSEGVMDFVGDEESKDSVSKVTFARNKKVQDRLNVSLKFITSIKGNNDNRYNYIATVENAMKTGNPYDLIGCYSMNAASLAIDGFLAGLEDYSMIELEKPYWSADIQKNSRLNNHIYFCSGSISAMNIYQTMILIFNVEKANSVGLDDPRYLVEDMTWTMETFYEMCTKASFDNNSDGKDESDSFGLVMHDSVFGDGFLAGCGLHYLSADESGKLIISPDFKSEKMYDLVRTLCAKFASSDYWYQRGSGTYGKIFYENRALFMGGHFEILKNNRSQIQFDYGYLPFPMADRDQNAYYTTCGFPYTMYAIPANAGNGERSAYVMECLASESYRMVQPFIFDSIKYQSSTDPINATMFDIIIEAKTYDFGRLFHNIFEWEDSPVAIFRTRLYTNDPQFYSELENHESAILSALQIINNKFE